MTTQTHLKLADLIAVAAVPASGALWLADIDLVLRILVSVGTLVLIGFALYTKWKHWRRP